MMGKPPISVKWVDVNKGDDLNPNYRSRLVAREIVNASRIPPRPAWGHELGRLLVLIFLY